MDIVLFGIQGSGKGTQAKKLAAEYGFFIFETGAELRKIAASGTPLGQVVSSHIDHGHLAPHEIVMQVVDEAVKKIPASQRILFDGIPRSIEQQKDFDEVMKNAGREFRCIELIVDEEAALQRILGRAKEEGRADDSNEEFIRRRMNTFKEKTRPVIDVYAANGMLTTVDGEGTVDEVYGRMKAAVGGNM
jgi:adenylate kinase